MKENNMSKLCECIYEMMEIEIVVKTTMKVVNYDKISRGIFSHSHSVIFLAVDYVTVNKWHLAIYSRIYSVRKHFRVPFNKRKSSFTVRWYTFGIKLWEINLFGSSLIYSFVEYINYLHLTRYIYWEKLYIWVI